MFSVPAPAPAVKPARSARDRLFDPDKASCALPDTRYNHDLYALFMLAEHLEDKIAEFVDTHDGESVTKELLLAGAIDPRGSRDPVFVEDVLVRVEHMIENAAGFAWAVRSFCSMVEGEVIAVDLDAKDGAVSEDVADVCMIATAAVKGGI